MKCQTNDCEEIPAYRFTWPGKDEARCCPGCMLKLVGVARAIGLHLQMVPLGISDYLERANASFPSVEGED